jgi:hypothetical protein
MSGGFSAERGENICASKRLGERKEKVMLQIWLERVINLTLQ